MEPKKFKESLERVGLSNKFNSKLITGQVLFKSADL